jgi:quinol monooxygenase YgiN
MGAVAVIATLKVQEGKNAEFEAAFEKGVAGVKTNEPDTPVYTLTQSQSDPQLYRVLEVYNTEEALAAHGQSAHFKELAGTLKTTLAGPLEIERLTVKF